MTENYALNAFLNKRIQAILTTRFPEYKSHTEQAELLGMSRGTYINFRYRRSNLTTDRLATACSRLGVSMSWLFSGFENG